MSVVLTISVSDIQTVLATFSHIRVKRSTVGVGGPYDTITDETPIAATLLAPLQGNYDVEGKTLSIKIDNQPQVDILFTGSLAPLTPAQVVDQINTAVGDVVASEEDQALRLTSTQTGTASAVEVVGGSAAAEFGWTGDERDIGEDAHIQLISGQSLYNYTDADGDGDHFYKVQYYNQVSNLASNDSAPFQGEPGTIVDAEKLSKAKVQLVDGRGIAIPNQTITFYAVYELLEVDSLIVGLQRSPIGTITTDAVGKGELPLVRGQRVKVVFDGTSVIREFVVPDEAEFDLLSELGTSPDPFDIKSIEFPAAIRRTL
jgi:hypothetical protein